MTGDPTPVLFSYDISVFGRKIEWFLTLRGIKYALCTQPNRMPRPDLEQLGIAYRKIPILAIGRDIYCDTRLIIDKLEQLFPENRLGSNNPFEQGLEKILSTWSQDGGPFWRTSQCIPADLDVMLDEKFVQDRSEAIGGKFDPAMLTAIRPEALAHQKIYLDPLEYGLLADGRDFVLNTPEPSLADLQAIWTFEWLTGDSMKMGQTLDPDVVSDAHYPKVYAWIKRFRKAVEAAKHKQGLPGNIPSKDAVDQILSSDFWEIEGQFDELDPLRLKKGQRVQVYASDYGSSHKDKGELLWICSREVVIQSKVKQGDGYLRLHFPRINFRIEPLED